MSKSHPPNCYQCRDYFVTWDPGFPMGCRQFGFRGKQMPSVEVLQTTGQHCLYFRPKKAAAPEKPPEPPLPPGSSMSFTV